MIGRLAFVPAAAAALLVVAGTVLPLVVRAEMWRTRMPRAQRRRDVLGWTAAAAVLNQVVGLRSGDVLRVAIAARTGGLTTGAGSVATFRAAEFAGMVLFGAVAAASVLSRGRAALTAAAAALALAAAGFAVTRLRAGSPRLADVPARRALVLVAGAVALPALEMPTVLGVGLALGEPIGVADAALLVAAAAVGQVLAFLPANAGTTEAALAAALALTGRDGAALWFLPLWIHVARVGAAVLLAPLALPHLPLMELKSWLIARR